MKKGNIQSVPGNDHSNVTVSAAIRLANVCNISSILTTEGAKASVILFIYFCDWSTSKIGADFSLVIRERKLFVDYSQNRKELFAILLKIKISVPSKGRIGKMTGVSVNHLAASTSYIWVNISQSIPGKINKKYKKANGNL